MKKILIFIALIGILNCVTVKAINNLENNPETAVIAETGVDKEVDDLLKGLESILDPNNNEFEQKMNTTLEKHKDKALVKLFQKIADALTHFLDALFNLASEASEVAKA